MQNLDSEAIPSQTQLKSTMHHWQNSCDSEDQVITSIHNNKNMHKQIMIVVC